MRVYKINIEHRDAGTNYSSKLIFAENFKEAVAKATKDLSKVLLIESVELLHQDVE